MSDKLNENLNENEALLNEEKASEEQGYNPDEVKLEENDNWEFEATAHTLEDTLIENDEIEIELPKEKPSDETRQRPKAENKEKKETQSKPKKDSRNSMLFISVSILMILMAGVLGFFGFRYYNNANLDETMNPGNVALTVDGTKISVGLYNYYYNSVVDTYIQNAENVGLDTTKSYKTQKTKDENGKTTTWSARFKDETLFQLQQLIAYYNSGVENGMELTKNQEKEIKETISSIKKQAKEQEMTVDEYISTNYGNYCGLATIKKMLNYNYMASLYLQKYNVETKPAKKQLDKYLDEHKNDYLNTKISLLFFQYDDNNKDAQLKLAQETAAKVKTADDMKKLIPKVYKELINQYVQSGQATEEAIISKLEEEITTDVPRSNTFLTDEANKWLGDDTVKVGSVKLFNDEKQKIAYILIKESEPKFDESMVYSVRHILIQPEKETDDATGQQKEATPEAWKKADEKAKKVLNEYKKGEKNEYAFALLAEKYSEDPGSVSDQGGNFGGLYENVPQGQMVKEFEGWSTDKNRKYGDIDIIKTDYGYHIMYFISNEPKYLAEAKKNFVATEMTDSFIKKYEVREHKHAMKNTTEAKPDKNNGATAISGQGTGNE
ncbi:MAG: peptidylprolyl isomerase [Eubacterium sp.]|nr:peptidylprolyl isomerase [Eubacterium sp.]